MLPVDAQRALFEQLVVAVKDAGGKVRDDLFGLHEFDDGTSRGIIAKKDMKKGETLVEIPHNLLLCAENVRNFKPLEKIFANLTGFSEFDLLAIFMIWICCNEENQQKADAVTRLHLALMPQVERGSSAMNHHMFWTEKELAGIQGTDAMQTAQVLKMQVRKDFGELVAEVFIKHPTIFPLEKFDYRTYKWALGLLWSRVMDFQYVDNRSSSTGRKKGKGNKNKIPAGNRSVHLRCIVPICDMFNTDFQGEMSHCYVESKRSVLLRAAKDWKKGEQIFINYSPTPLSRMLQLYGFVTYPIPAYNSIQLWAAMDSNHASFETVSKKIREALPGFDPQTTPFSLSEKDPLPKGLVKALNIQRGFDANESVANVNVFKELEAALMYRMQGYAGGSVAEDQSLLLEENISERKRIAVIVRLGEKKILAKALKKVQLTLKLKYNHDSTADETEVEQENIDEDLVVTELEKAGLDGLD